MFSVFRRHDGPPSYLHRRDGRSTSAQSDCATRRSLSSGQSTSDEGPLSDPATEAHIDRLLNVLCGALKSEIPAERLLKLRAELLQDMRTSERLDTFLDTLTMPLSSSLPTDELSNLRREIRAHLDARIAAYEELGSSHEEAVSEALRQFGDSRSALATWETAWIEADPVLKRRAARRAANVGLRWAGGDCGAMILLLFATGNRINYDYGEGLLEQMLFLLPVIMGLGIGVHASDRPIRATLSALGRLYVPVILVYRLMLVWIRFDNPWMVAVLLATLQFVSWAVVGSLTAGIMGWVQRTTRRLGKSRATE